LILDKLLPVLTTAAEEVHEVAEHAAEHGGHAGPPELPNIIHMLYLAFGEAFSTLYHWENIIFGFCVLTLLCLLSMRIYAKRQMIPGKLQNVAEIAVEGLDNFFHSIIGHGSRRYTPFLGTLFLYILVMNIMGLVPLLKSPTSSMNITLSLALCTFFYVQAAGLRRLGPVGFVDHLLGSPRDVMGWILVPINLPIHVLGELSKPISLSLRLFGNITGEDVLIAAFTGLGIAMLAFMNSPVGVPIQVPFYFLAILTSTIQALVFTLLSAVYFAMMMPHHEEEH
jgi:F-type H+-transporting ATPase subunit a